MAVILVALVLVIVVVTGLCVADKNTGARGVCPVSALMAGLRAGTRRLLSLCCCGACLLLIFVYFFV